MKTKMLLNNMIIASAFLLLAVGTAQHVNAAEPATKKPLLYGGSTQQIKVGDSIWIHKDTLHYLTGERISKWVYTKPHAVQQVGGKRYPYGVLLQGIYSWVYPGSIVPVHPEQPTTVEESPAESISEQTPLQTIDSVQADTVQEVLDSIPVPVAENDTIAEETLLEEATEELVQEEPVDTVVLQADILRTYGKGNYEIPVSYQMNRFSLGVRGGFASTMANGEKMPKGYDALLDIRYAYYWANDQNKPAMGIMTGLNVGYLQTSQSTEINDEYSVSTVDGDIKYVISAEDVTEKNTQVQLELPIMFSMVAPKGFFLNVGPKLILPVYSTYAQTLTNPNIYAYLPELNGRPIMNEVVTGKVKDEQVNITGNIVDNPSKLLSLAVAAELGYEFKLKNGHSLDLGVYADYSVFTLYNNSIKDASKIISITPPTHTSEAIVDVQPISRALGNKYAFLDAGLKLTYNFDFIK